ncbi:unnamed protein product [Brachionus calyciflorus]|uniref:Amine oxidase domain-containing protein n=1 Tax=Brachionus calyciflorus TaxID=104777 RepID=A0A813YSR0_9BILA|nr:unnamed protein product [Brachionus calyciflorus]
MSNKVIVIGAGIAGLAAANYFVQNGYNDFVVLEASNYIGGRIKTMPFQKSFIEIGAQWMHGTENNPVYDIAASIDAVDDSTDKADTIYYSTQDGQRLDEEIVEAIQEELENKMDKFEDVIDESDLNQSLGDLLDELYRKIKVKYNSKLDNSTLKGVFRAALNDEKFENACDDLHDVSTNGWNNFETLGGNLLCNTKYGYSNIVDYLASKLPKGSIKLNNVVEKIDWSGDEVVVSVYDNSEQKRKSYTGKVVLCTVSLGVLKRSHTQLFKPKLPQNKIQSIDRLGFGLINKIFVIFEKNFKPDFLGLKIIWNDDLEFELQRSKKKWNLDDSEFFKAFDNFEKLHNQKNILFCFTAGKDAEYIENLEDECILDVISELLERSFPYANLPKPIKIIRSRWNSNAYSRGSYSYIRVGSSIEDMNTLAETVENKLFFAGEATMYQYFGNVHAAYKSGFDRASEILNLLENASED